MKTSTSRKSQICFAILLLAFSLSHAQTGDVIVHDPVMIREGKQFYVFGSGKGISVKSSSDMKTWKRENPVFAIPPAWAKETVPRTDGSMWAPDILYKNGTYFLYYSVSAFGRNNSAIGLVTNQTLNPADPRFKWVDHGIVVRSVPGRDMWNAIDPNLAFDEKNIPWLVFGSFWNGIKIVKLQENLMAVVSDSTQEWHTVAARERNWKVDELDAGDAANPELDYPSIYTPEQLETNRNMKNGSIEAPFIFRKNDYYYLFVSWDRCCKGLQSSYKIAVGRSKKITGPYVDKNDVKMVHGGGTVIAKGDDQWAAVGHEAVYTIDGKDYIVYHAYDKSDGGKPKLRIRELTWDEQGWPKVE